LELLGKVLLYDTLVAQHHFTIFLHFSVEMKNKKQIYKFSESSNSRMQRFEESHAAREPQFGHPSYM